jgi:archaeosine synthase
VFPRELEYTFPAAHYDIPVTGDWSIIEKANLIHDIEKLVGKCPKTATIVGYVKGVEAEALKSVCDKLERDLHLIDCETSSLTSKVCLTKFRSLLKENLTHVPKIKINHLVHFLRAVADFQFGKGIGPRLITEDVEIRGRKEIGLRIQHKKKHLLTFRSSIGFFTLSLEAAIRIKDHSNNIVTFDGEQIQGSTIFNNAICEADPEITINDEVIVQNKQGEVIATGVASLPGNLLKTMSRGPGIKIRQKVK